MKFNIIQNNQLNFSDGIIILPTFENEMISFKKLDITPKILTISNNLIKDEKFKSKKGEVYFFNFVSNGKIINVILAGLGKKEDINLKTYTTSFIKAVKKALSLNIKNIFLAIRPFEHIDYELYMRTVIRHTALTDYKFDKYKKSEDKNEEEIVFNIISNEVFEMRDDVVEKALLESELISYTRNLVNEPANVLTPEALAEEALKTSKKYGFEAEIFDEDYIKSKKMDAFLSVAKGSVNRPKLIVLRYKGNKNDEKTYGLIGKGLCYDSGGYSIKPTSSMLEMKSDMGGSATVIGAMALIAKNKLKVNVTAVIAACENLIDGNAYKPGDIISTMDGAFIEVDNTDAEGRLTLADAVTYSIEEEKVSQIIELSTLTGAVIVALGDDITGVITKYDDIYEDLKKASKDTLDESWQLPYHEEYMSLLKSDVADMKNSGGRAGGSITAGLFVTKFAKDTPIAHLDIAGSAWSENGDVLHTKGGTGNSVLMLYKYFENISK